MADAVGLAFAVSASSFCPLLVLGIWWRRLTRPGAAAGMLIGGGSAFLAVTATMAGYPGAGPWHALLAWPALWSVPLGFLTMVLVSLATPGRVPPGTAGRPGPLPPAGRAAYGGVRMSGFLAGLLVAVLPLLAAGFWLGRRTARPASLAGLGTPVEHATFETLHTASLATPPLRAGLTEETARKSARKLRSLLGTDALCLTDREQVLVWDGVGAHHRTEIMERLTGPLDTGRGEAFP